MTIRPKNIAFGGIRTANLDETVAFFRDVMGLEVDHADEVLAAFRCSEQDTFEVFSEDDPEHDFMTTGPVIGFGVDDVAAARVELESRGVEFLEETQSRGGHEWAHFRGPDGVVYEITKA